MVPGSRIFWTGPAALVGVDVSCRLFVFAAIGASLARQANSRTKYLLYSQETSLLDAQRCLIPDSPWNEDKSDKVKGGVKLQVYGAQSGH